MLLLFDCRDLLAEAVTRLALGRSAGYGGVRVPVSRQCCILASRASDCNILAVPRGIKGASNARKAIINPKAEST